MPDTRTDTIFSGEADNDTLGSRIQRSRTSAAISVAEAARRLGVKKATYESWEADRSEPRAHHMVRLAGIMGVSPAWIIGGMGEAPDGVSLGEEIKMLQQQVNQLKDLRNQTDSLIDSMENAVGRLAKRLEQG